MNVTVFGGAKPKAGEIEYLEAQRLGQLLANAGHTVITGGYGGTMAAVSRGANEAGGRVIGVTCLEIENWSGSKANPWVTEEWKAPTLHERMVLLMDRAEAVLALPGGVGTLAEISLLWNRMAIETTPRRKLILIGAGWRAVLDELYRTLDGYYPAHYRAMLDFAPDVDTAAAML